MKWLLPLLLAGCGASATGNADESENAADADDANGYSAEQYAICAACHLMDGVGIPGAFPPLRNRVAAMAALEGGRQYLVSVASDGLMGAMTANGQSYSGVMPGQKSAMSPAVIAAALNFAMFELTDDKSSAADLQPFSAAEVEAIQAGSPNGNMATSAKTRVELIELHGDQWPQ